MSKLDQLRAMREANATRPVFRPIMAQTIPQRSCPGCVVKDAQIAAIQAALVTKSPEVSLQHGPVGRPRKYASGAERVAAFRSRKAAEQKDTPG